MERYFTKGSRILLQNGQSAEVIAKLGEGRDRINGIRFGIDRS